MFHTREYGDRTAAPCPTQDCDYYFRLYKEEAAAGEADQANLQSMSGA